MAGYHSWMNLSIEMIKNISLTLCIWLSLADVGFACTDEFKPVCGYWMHNSKTQTFVNECKAREAGAKVRHNGSCVDGVKAPKK